ncbi:MAG: acetylglutamate kinase [Acidimicrobiia bacterium]
MEQRTAHAREKAAVLAEALPYIKRFSGATIVIKYGGHAMDDAEASASFAEDVVLMRLIGMNPVVVHGGGPQISDLMRRLGKEPTFVNGRRVTDAETVEIVRMALIGQVNASVVTSINRQGSFAVGISGEDASMITARQGDPELGFVGEVASINPSVIHKLLNEELIPVIATTGVDTEGQGYNINADTVAGAIAESLNAEKLVYLTDVAGIYRSFPEEDSLIARCSPGELERLDAAGAFDAGMIPKVHSIVAAVKAGVRRAHVLDGRVPHALLLEFFTDAGIGTMVSNDADDAEARGATS